MYPCAFNHARIACPRAMSTTSNGRSRISSWLLSAARANAIRCFSPVEIVEALIWVSVWNRAEIPRMSSNDGASMALVSQLTAVFTIPILFYILL